MRKTVHVERIREKANNMLENSTDECKEGRIGIYVLLESILHETGNYRGFKYTRLPADWDYDAPYDQEQWDKVDETRRYYF